MGIFDKIKDSAKDMTGLGLNAQEQYDRAWAKGVLLNDFKSAAQNFTTAAEKFSKEGKSDMARRAMANAALYKLIGTGDRSGIPEAVKALGSIPEMEQIGTRQETIKTDPLVQELMAIMYEHQADSTSDPADRRTQYKKAYEIFIKMGRVQLPISEKLHAEGPVDKATNRAFYCDALSDYYAGRATVLVSPQEANNCFEGARQKFRQAGATDWATKTEDIIKDVKAKRHCWICGREMQGKDIFFRYYPAEIHEYHKSLLETLKQDAHMIDTPGSVTVCTACGSTIENQADLYATKRMEELKEWVTPILAKHWEAIEILDRRLRDVERAKHSH